MAQRPQILLPSGPPMLRRRRCLWHLSTALVLLLLFPHPLVLASELIPVKVPPVASRDIASLLVHTLPQFDINPRRVPGHFQRQAIQRVYEYTRLYRDDVQAMLQRTAPYLPMIKHVLQWHGLPAYFAYVPLAESAFQVGALHPKTGARGLWQLMPDTARSYGLHVSPQRDERLDPTLATQAAARHLHRLQERFGPQAPLYVLAAYNYGATNLAEAMAQARTRDIWYLYTHRRLPPQTRDYLLKMVTLWMIVTHAERFRFSLEGPELPQLTTAPGPRMLALALALTFSTRTAQNLHSGLLP